jgi:hypothetical protein
MTAMKKIVSGQQLNFLELNDDVFALICRLDCSFQAYVFISNDLKKIKDFIRTVNIYEKKKERY